MYWEIDNVAFAGPPFVMFMTSSKSCKVPIVEVIDVNKIIGFNKGTVMLKN
ncbi:hypothetical protein D1872_322690 [compost metagenome]